MRQVYTIVYTGGEAHARTGWTPTGMQLKAGNASGTDGNKATRTSRDDVRGAYI